MKNGSKNEIFFAKIKKALENNWCSDQEKIYWLEILNIAKLYSNEKDGKEALNMLEDEFKYNESFKQKTGIFKND